MNKSSSQRTALSPEFFNLISGLTMDCSPAGSSVQGILQTRILEWKDIARGRSQSREQTRVSCIAGREQNILFKLVNPWVLGASMRHSAHGKGHKEGGSTYAKAGSSLRSPPGNPQASPPITRACLLYYLVLSPTPLTLRGAVPHHLFQRRS